MMRLKTGSRTLAENAVTVHDGAIVTLTQAVYDAAVADADFTPNENAIFLTSA